MSDTSLEPVVDVARRKADSAVMLAIGCALVAAGLWAGFVHGMPLPIFFAILMFHLAISATPVFLPAPVPPGLVRWAVPLLGAAATFVILWALGFPHMKGGMLPMVLGLGAGSFVGQHLDGEPDRAIGRPVARIVVSVALPLCVLGLALTAGR